MGGERMRVLKIVLAAATAAILIPGCMGGEDDLGTSSDGHGRPAGGCWITGGGQILPETLVGGSFGGNAKDFVVSGLVDGEWNHVTFDGDHFHGDPDFIVCYRDSRGGPTPPRAIPNNADFGGMGTWNGEEGYYFEVHIEDRGEPGEHDYYKIWVYQADNGGHTVYYSEGYVEHGNLQIHPPNPGHPGITNGV